MQLRRRIGVFGGAFDPPHRAHVAMAAAAIDQLALDRLWVVPTGHAWHKARPLSDGHHRLAMAKLAFSGLSRVQVTDLELKRSGPSYTADTLQTLQSQDRLPSTEDEWFLLMGADQAAAFHTWKRQDEILKRARLAVARRSTKNADPVDVQAHFSWPVVVIEMPLDPISSTFVRAQLTQIDGMPADQPILDESVARYIAQHNLYQDTK